MSTDEGKNKPLLKCGDRGGKNGSERGVEQI
jgi:hypothetical protein